MKAFAATLLAAVSFAQNSSMNEYGQHFPSLNDHFDNNDQTHNHYGGDSASSPAYPAAPNLNEAVDAFDTYGTLFGEHRYQLQVAKTGNMLIGTEALRESISTLQYRVHTANRKVTENDKELDTNDEEMNWNRGMISQNRERMYQLDSHVHELEVGYTGLSAKLAVDREAVIMMCHQYAYADTLPRECQAILGSLSGPINFAWNWPQNACGDNVGLPPFGHPLAQYDIPEPYGPGWEPQPYFSDNNNNGGDW